MNFNLCGKGCFYKRFLPNKLFLALRIIVFFITAAFLQVSAKGYGQLISLKERNKPLTEIFTDIEHQSGYSVFFKGNAINRIRVSIDVENVSLETVIKQLLENQPYTYSILDKMVILKEKYKTAASLVPITVSGRVVDDKGLPIYGATVQVKQSRKTTFTNANGEFSILAEPGNTLMVSMLGYKQVEMAINNRTTLNFTLNIAITSLEEAVVVGYGTTSKRLITGAIGSYNMEANGELPLTLDNALVGRIAGVNVIPSSGVPGSASTIVIRGITSINGNGNKPLFVIDGVPIYGMDRDLNNTNFAGRVSGAAFSGVVNGAMEQNTRETFESNPLAFINPDDIESIDILKDAYATAIYGSRGASGVILIKTKKGNKKAAINLQLGSSFKTPFGTYKTLNGDEYAGFYNDYMKALSRTTVFPTGINTNWLDEVSQTGHGYNATFNASNGNDKGSYYISGAYIREDPYIKKSTYDRYTGRVNLNQKLSDRLNAGVNLSLTSTKNNALNAQLAFLDAAITAPNKPVYDPYGNYTWGLYNNPPSTSDAATRDLNAVGLLNTTINYLQENAAIGNIYAELELASWLKLRSEFGVDWSMGRAYMRAVNKPKTVNGVASESDILNRRWVTNNTLTINKIFGKSQINAVAGQSFEASKESNSLLSGRNFPNDEVLSINNATTKTLTSALQQSWALASYFARVNYVFDYKYMLGVTYRLDGSSKFSINKRYAGFPSFSAGWDLGREDFMKQFTFIDQLKLRSSIGLSGSDGGAGYYGNQGVYANGSGNASWGGEVTIVPSTAPTPDLKWETRTKYDLGLDISLFKQRVNITADYYHEKTKNVIVALTVPSYLGYSLMNQNVGEIVNKGVEFTINTHNIVDKNFKWETSFNIARNINKITQLYPNAKNGSEQTLGYFAGQSTSVFWLYEWGGVNPDNGNPLWVDGNGVVTEKNVQLAANGGTANRKFMGDASPKFFGGFNNTINYKGLEFNAFFSFAYGNKMINGAKAYLFSYTGNDGNNLSVDMLNYWKSAGQVTEIPALLNESNSFVNTVTGVRNFNNNDNTLSRFTSRFLEDASYIKLRTVSLGYNFKPAVLRKLGNIPSLKIYGQMDNVFVITKYSGIDPEVSAFGSSALGLGRDEFTMPAARTFRVGIKAGF